MKKFDSLITTVHKLQEDNGTQNGNYCNMRGYIGIMKKNTQATIMGYVLVIGHFVS